MKDLTALEFVTADSKEDTRMLCGVNADSNELTRVPIRIRKRSSIQNVLYHESQWARRIFLGFCLSLKSRVWFGLPRLVLDLLRLRFSFGGRILLVAA